jgi:hypothetical protein
LYAFLFSHIVPHVLQFKVTKARKHVFKRSVHHVWIKFRVILATSRPVMNRSSSFTWVAWISRTANEKFLWYFDQKASRKLATCALLRA